MATHPHFKAHRDQAFLIGMFSVLDALLDTSIEQLVEQLPLADDVKLALREREGPLGTLLNLKSVLKKPIGKVLKNTA
uniref:hypothetical protein n=1 Tax=Vibrio cholerae TaxID=666 RepID=UPI003F5852FF